MKKIHLLLIISLLFAIPNLTKAAFPDDLEGVIFDEEGLLPGLTDFMLGMRETSSLSVFIGGSHPYKNSQNLVFNASKGNVWPVGGGNISCCNANGWIFIKVGERWHANTFEYYRKGQTTKSTEALTGPAHIRGANFRNFRPRNGEIYGFMMSGMVRAGLARNNVRERTEISFYKYGVGPVSKDEIRGTPEPEPEQAKPNVTPAVNLLLGD